MNIERKSETLAQEKREAHYKKNINTLIKKIESTLRKINALLKTEENI